MKRTTSCLTIASSLFLLLNVLPMSASATETNTVDNKEQKIQLAKKTSEDKTFVRRTKGIVCELFPELCVEWPPGKPSK